MEPQENIELEAQLAEVKAVLKAQKEDVANMVKALEEEGRELSRSMSPNSSFSTIHSQEP